MWNQLGPSSKADRSTIQKLRTDENNAEYTKIYRKSERVQTGALREKGVSKLEGNNRFVTIAG